MPDERILGSESVLPYVRRDVPLLERRMSVGEALDAIRRHGLGERIVYFYVVDGEGRLQGVVPTRRLLLAEPHRTLAEIMVPKAVAIGESATVLEAYEMFHRHRFLAFPVVDGEGRVAGIVDAHALTDRAFDLAEREEAELLFEAFGFRLTQARDTLPWRAFRIRFPWLLVTIASGSLCAVLAGAFAETLASHLVIAFFLTLVLALGESVGMQSTSVAIQALRNTTPTLSRYLGSLRREMGTAGLLGAGCGAAVAGIVGLWHGGGGAAAVVGASVFLSLMAACFFGMSVPWLLHRLRLDPKVAAGPVALAATDFCTLAVLLTLAATWL